MSSWEGRSVSGPWLREVKTELQGHFRVYRTEVGGPALGHGWAGLVAKRTWSRFTRPSGSTARTKVSGPVTQAMGRHDF